MSIRRMMAGLSGRAPARDPGAGLLTMVRQEFGSRRDHANQQRAILPGPEGIDIARELDAVRGILSSLPLERPFHRKIERSLTEARKGATLPRPDREAVGEGLNRALKTARRSDAFGTVAEPLRTHVVRATAWLGKGWGRILGAVDMSA